MFSAAQCAWCKGAEQGVLCAGNTDEGAVTTNTLFDIASLTKVYAASACLRLVDRGTLDPTARIVDFFPRAACREATLTEVLAHEAGFAACPPLYAVIPAAERGSETAGLRIMEAALTEAPADKPGARCLYSDLGYIALAGILEFVAGRRLDEVIDQEVLSPLGLRHTTFHPLLSAAGESEADIALTAPDLPKGAVHDDNARAMGGLSAHAGLFSTARDVCAFGHRWLTALNFGGWLSVPTARTAVTQRPLGRGLGWDFKSAGYSSAGTKMGKKTFGHLGFTGCSLWVDPERELSIALLTNRVCYGNDNPRIRDFRPLFHDTLSDVIG